MVRGKDTFQCLEKILLEHYSAEKPIKFEGKRHMEDLDSFISHFTFTKNSQKLQAKIVAAHKETKVADIEKDQDLAPSLKALWRSRCNKYSAAPWRAYPLTTEFQLSTDQTTKPGSCCNMRQAHKSWANLSTAHVIKSWIWNTQWCVTQQSCRDIIYCRRA